MGAERGYGRRRPCSRACCLPNTRTQDRERIRTDVAEGLADLEKAQLEEAINPGREEPLTEYELENALRGVLVSTPRELIGPQWLRELVRLPLPESDRTTREAP